MNASELVTKTDLDAAMAAQTLQMKSDIGTAETRLESRIDRLENRIEAMLLRHAVATILGVLAVGGLLIRFMR